MERKHPKVVILSEVEGPLMVQGYVTRIGEILRLRSGRQRVGTDKLGGDSCGHR